MKYMNQAQMDVIVMIRNTFENGELEEKIKDVETRFKRYAAFLQSSLSSSEMSIPKFLNASLGGYLYSDNGLSMLFILHKPLKIFSAFRA